ncbi:MAG: asparagine synthase (glutamine-hydrolyzing) [Pseudomonadales bacterium]|nr:asparagine synthase (glutamine-hydrolyzing) [Pseudomonadales bacterium]
MCGIAGFIGQWPRSLLEDMVAAERHRGPDGIGYFHNAEAGIGFGHARLSIIDLSEEAAQPMTSEGGRYTITFNGEIYNYRSLRTELEAAGVRVRTHSDTEILLQLFIRHGPRCVERLHGIFAFAVWDATERRLFLARDHLGVKPLYYAALAKGFLFASELKVLTLCPDLDRSIEPAAVSDHLGFLWTAGEATMLRAVKKLRPGGMLTVDADGIRKERYYRAPLAGTVAGEQAIDACALLGLIDEIVAEQMVADVEVGALLSGGVDSSAIVASMCRVTEPARITTFCGGVSAAADGADNFGADAGFARLVANGLGVRLIEVSTGADLIDSLPGMVWSLDEPTADFSALQTQLLARAARDAGIKVLLSGAGADDIFTGFGRHSLALLFAALDRAPGLRQSLAVPCRLFPPRSIRGRRLRRIGELLAMKEETMLGEAMSLSSVSGERRLSLLSSDVRAQVTAGGLPEPFVESLVRTRGLHPVERLLDLDINGFMPDHNLNYADKMAMQEGVEIRVPFCDPRLVDFAMRCSLYQKIDFRQTKKILRQSQKRRVPDAVLTRPKQGFGAPVRDWLKGPARAMMEELTSAQVIEARGLFDAGAVAALKSDFLAGRIDAAFSLFPLMTVELWCRTLDTAPVSRDGSVSAVS